MDSGTCFNAQHSPIGAYASFTLGARGRRGGLGIERARPADEDVFVGLEERTTPGKFCTLPFHAERQEDVTGAFEVAGPAEAAFAPMEDVRAVEEHRVRRDFDVGTDTFAIDDLTLCVYTPALPLPDPDAPGVDERALRLAVTPALIVELTIDNRGVDRERLAFFGYAGSDPYQGMRRLDDQLPADLCGIGQGVRTAVVTSREDGRVHSALGFGLEAILKARHLEDFAFGLGQIGLLRFVVRPGELHTFRLAVCFHHEGNVTAGLATSYLYTRFFPTIEQVAVEALASAPERIAAAQGDNQRLAAAGLSEDQRLCLIHAIHSYYGSTQLLHDGARARWVVNEGEYRMMNTFDLTVDQLFFEMRAHPWTVRNVLTAFAERWSYVDRLSPKPGEDAQEPDGGLSFTHDQGVAGVWSSPGTSAYERSGLRGCFSYMTHEQLVNWVLCTLVYVHRAGDAAFLARCRPLLLRCLESLVRRDHPEERLRTGVMKWDSSKVRGGAEITTYDSLDTSLGQARSNVYLAVKTWAAYVGLAHWLPQAGFEEGGLNAGEQARRCAATIVSFAQGDGSLPAILEPLPGGGPPCAGSAARIVPAVEGLVFPRWMGCPEAVEPSGPFAELLRALRRHVDVILRPGLCLFDDGGYKLSSTSDNSWLSKIFLCQHVVRSVLGRPRDALDARADRAHADWLRDRRNTYWCFSDQMVAGIARGSRYYPRGVTAVLWLDETWPGLSG